jgi:hypothetical protein
MFWIEGLVQKCDYLQVFSPTLWLNRIFRWFSFKDCDLGSGLRSLHEDSSLVLF